MKNKGTILFVNPPLSPYSRYGILSQAGAIEPPLGLAYLAAVTRKAGLKTLVLDSQALNFTLEDSLAFIIK